MWVRDDSPRETFVTGVGDGRGAAEAVGAPQGEGASIILSKYIRFYI
jgi:hypothetical protein